MIAERPNQLWGTDVTTTFVEEDGQGTILAAIDHYSADGIGIHAVKGRTGLRRSSRSARRSGSTAVLSPSA
jgi:hypothetical protein